MFGNSPWKQGGTPIAHSRKAHRRLPIMRRPRAAKRCLQTARPRIKLMSFRSLKRKFSNSSEQTNLLRQDRRRTRTSGH